MLVLSRKEGSRVRLEIGGVTIWVTLVRKGGSRRNAKLGFEAPIEVRILREEVVKKIEAEKGQSV